MSRSTLKTIDGEKLREEFKRRNLRPSEASMELGFSQGIIAAGIRANKLNTVVINGLKLRYSIEPSSYVIQENTFPCNTAKEQSVFTEEVLQSLHKVIYSAVYEAVKKAWAE